MPISIDFIQNRSPAVARLLHYYFLKTFFVFAKTKHGSQIRASEVRSSAGADSAICAYFYLFLKKKPSSCQAALYYFFLIFFCFYHKQKHGSQIRVSGGKLYSFTHNCWRRFVICAHCKFA